MEAKKTAIVLVCYNRKDCLGRLLRSLEQAVYPEQVTLIISIDKSKTDAVERFADDYHWPHGEKRVVRHDENLGLRRHMLSLGRHFSEFDALIVLEDDVTVAPSFYLYARASIEKYHTDEDIAGISLYSFSTSYQTFLPFTPARTEHDVYLMNCAISWGQVWMKHAWESFMEWYASHNEEFCLPHLPESINRWPKSSWLKYHIRYCIEQNKYFVYPYTSLSTNNADPGVNFDHSDTMFQASMLHGIQKDFRLPASADIEVRYDGFFQAKYLAGYLGIAEGELCVDLFSNKPDCLFRRYVLTNRQLPYAVVKSFALQMRPIEMNIIHDRRGEELFLYDTTQPAAPPKMPDRYLAYAYFYGQGFYKARTMIGTRRTLEIIKNNILDKITRRKR